MALSRRPRLLVLDEPTTGLDPVARHEVMQEISEVLLDFAPHTKTQKRSRLRSEENKMLADRFHALDAVRAGALLLGIVLPMLFGWLVISPLLAVIIVWGAVRTVFTLQVLVAQWPLHWLVKFPLILAVTVAVLLLSYQWLVRPTRLGVWLGGKPKPRFA